MIHGWKAYFMRNTDRALFWTNSQWIKRIEQKHFHIQKFNSRYLMQYPTKSNSFYISMLSSENSTQSLQCNEELRVSNSNLLEEQSMETIDSRPCKCSDLLLYSCYEVWYMNWSLTRPRSSSNGSFHVHVLDLDVLDSWPKSSDQCLILHQSHSINQNM